MKQFTLKELSILLSIPTNTIRRWCLKGEVGEVYNKEVWNQKEVRRQLRKYEDLDVKKLLNCEIDEIELIKAKKISTKNYISLKDLQINQTIILHNYSFESTLTLVDIKELNGQKIFTFVKDETNEFKTYSEDQLTKKNIKIEEI